MTSNFTTITTQKYFQLTTSLQIQCNINVFISYSTISSLISLNGVEGSERDVKHPIFRPGDIIDALLPET